MDEFERAIAIESQANIEDINQYVLSNPLKLQYNLLIQVINQTVFRKYLNSKMQVWANFNLIAPPKLALEQSSSDFTANYKAQNIAGSSGLDLTGGMGVDSYFLSKNFKNWIHNEPNLLLSQITAINFEKLGLRNVEFTNSLAEDFEFKQHFDLIFLDPSRRNDELKRVFKISDCQPNIVAIQDRLFKYSIQIMIKYAPMLDIKLALSELKFVKEISVIAQKNEVKELLFKLEKDNHKEVVIHTINQTSKGTIQEFSFTYAEEYNTSVQYGFQDKYLYEPNAAILKSGAFKLIATRFNVTKLSSNSHIYTSEIMFENFPGRKFKIIEILKPNKKEILVKLPSGNANITVRNFPMSVAEIRKKKVSKKAEINICFFTQNAQKKKKVILCEKL